MTSGSSSVAELFTADIEAWRQHGWPVPRGSKKALLLMLVHYGGLRATLIHRLAHHLHRRGVRLVPSLLSQLNVTFHGIEMSATVPVGPGLYMPHTVGTVVNARSVGANCTFQGGMTIGQKDDTGFPSIEDGVVLAAGCRVLGAIIVGANSTIGANAVVLRDVAAGSIMVGVPARDIRDRS